MERNRFLQMEQEFSRELLKDWKPIAEEKQVLYASAEVLLGRVLLNNLINLPEDHPFRRKMEEEGITTGMLAQMEEQEADAAMGNGGLGRLAACILESAANRGIPFSLSTIRYTEGLFRQDIRDGRQVGYPDLWLEPDGSHPMGLSCPGEWNQRVYFRHSSDNWVEVEMIPTIFPQIGTNGHVGVVLAWKVGQVRAQRDTDLSRYRSIDKRLYGKDSDEEGKMLRICQFYALSSATVGWMLHHCNENGIPVTEIPKRFCLHINDTHCAFMIPELMRRLLDEYHLPWGEAEKIAKKTFVYTNHTILAEALEKWPVWMIGKLMPRICELMFAFNSSAEGYYRRLCPGIPGSDIEKMRIVRDEQIHMAHLAIINGSSVNGVAKIHTRILCERELKPFYYQEPHKFHNVTNGVSQRLFLAAANPGLANLLDRCIGTGWRTDMSQISRLLPYVSDPEIQRQFMQIRRDCKAELARFLAEQENVEISPDFIFDIQIKRFHMYKRQLMNCLRILDLYFRVKEDPNFEMAPVAFIFGGKAAPGYREAELVIELIDAIARLVNNDDDVRDKMRVCFVRDYNVSKALKLFPATDISEQISTASKEASGTGCFKGQMNGALLLGTMDGANVEIREAAGEDSMFVFGMSADEIMAYEKGRGYDPMKLYQTQPRIRRAVDALVDGTLVRKDPPQNEYARFDELRDALLRGDSFFVLGDLMSYIAASDNANRLYRENPALWAEKSLRNIACSGHFSSDRMVDDYVHDVWKLK